MLTPFGHDIWLADGTEVAAALGFRYPTRMAVIRLPDDALFVWSPVALTSELQADIDALGTVRHLVAPNGLHHLFIADWQRAYPDARLYAAPGLPEKRRDMAFDTVLGAAAVAAWSGAIEHVVVPGNAITTEVVFFHRASGTVIFTDLLQQFPPRWFPGWRGIVARWDGMVGPQPSVPRKFRVAFTDRRAARAALARILAWPVERVLMAHGTPVTTNANACLREAFDWLTTRG